MTKYVFTTSDNLDYNALTHDLIFLGLIFHDLEIVFAGVFFSLN